MHTVDGYVSIIGTIDGYDSQEIAPIYALSSLTVYVVPCCYLVLMINVLESCKK